jgi:hypothetical protein
MASLKHPACPLDVQLSGPENEYGRGGKERNH